MYPNKLMEYQHGKKLNDSYNCWGYERYNTANPYIDADVRKIGRSLQGKI